MRSSFPKSKSIGVHVDIGYDTKLSSTTYLQAISTFFVHGGMVQIERLTLPNEANVLNSFDAIMADPDLW